jgi:spermidine/putrescine transport system permease protein
VVADQLTKARNWPLASAISMALTVITTIGIIMMMVLQKKDAQRTTDASKNVEGRGITN